MKRLLIYLLPLVLGLSAYVPEQINSQSPTPFTISDAELEKLTDEDIAKTDVHRKELLQKAKESVDRVGSVAVEQGASLAAVQAANAQATRDFADYKKVTEDQIAKGNQAIIKYAKKAAKLRLVGLVGNVMILAIAAFIALRVPAFGLYVGAGIALFASAAWWAWILL